MKDIHLESLYQQIEENMKNRGYIDAPISFQDVQLEIENPKRKIIPKELPLVNNRYLRPIQKAIRHMRQEFLNTHNSYEDRSNENLLKNQSNQVKKEIEKIENEIEILQKAIEERKA